MSETSAKSWVKLRQVVIATTSHDDDVDLVRQAFGLGKGFCDPELDSLHMVDATMPVARGQYLEFIGPASDEAAVLKWLTKIGGRGGYVLSVQHPDPAAVKQRAIERGIRVPVDVEALGHPVIQLHPQDVGLLLEVDGITDPERWFWDDIDSGPEADAAVSEIVSVQVPVADPAATNALWHDLLDLGTPAEPTVIEMGGISVEFVAGGPSAEWTVTLRRADSAAGASAAAPSLAGLRFELV
ncbi:hypothetical protein SAMN05444157_3244 [Frankineae bacterium MT45]|nr:hypothetical protein SAMN05444157_3244 [Frankineae bacterium MT45]